MSPDEHGYNGWCNKPTWEAHCWISNSPAPWGYAISIAASHRTRLGEWISHPGEIGQEIVNEVLIPMLRNSNAGESLIGELTRINHHEIGVGMMATVDDHLAHGELLYLNDGPSDHV